MSTLSNGSDLIAYALAQCGFASYLNADSAMNLRGTCKRLKDLIEYRPLSLTRKGSKTKVWCDVGRPYKFDRVTHLAVDTVTPLYSIDFEKFPKLATLRLTKKNVRKIVHRSLVHLTLTDTDVVNEIVTDSLKTLTLRNCVLELVSLTAPNLRVLYAEDSYVFADSFADVSSAFARLESVTNHLFVGVNDTGRFLSPSERKNRILYPPTIRSRYVLENVRELRVLEKTPAEALREIRRIKTFKWCEICLEFRLPRLTRIVGYQLNRSSLMYGSLRGINLADVYADVTYMDIYADGQVPFWRFINHCPKLRYLRLRDMRRRRRPPVFAHPTLETLILEDNSLKRPNRSFTYLSLDTPNLKKLVLIGARIRELPISAKVVFSEEEE